MEHKLDDFFRKKTKQVEDKLPDSSTFDEQLFWEELQKNLDKPKARGWWKWVATAACIAGLILWVVSVPTLPTEKPRISNVQKTVPRNEVAEPLTIVAPEKTKVRVHRLKKTEANEPKKGLKIEVEQLAVKVSPVAVILPTLRQDSIHYKPATIAEIKPQFRTIHVNEISNTEKSPLPQPKFKIRFAARHQH